MEKYYKELLELVRLCEDVYTFRFDGLLILGYKVDIVKEYLELNPSKKFRTWLIDRGFVINETLDSKIDKAIQENDVIELRTKLEENENID